MKANLHFEISLPVKVLSENFQMPNAPKRQDTYSYMRAPIKALSEEFKDWLETKYLHPRWWASLILFYAHPGSKTAVHTDIGHRNIWAMNIVLGEGEVDIHWHSVTDIGEVRQTDLNYQRFADDSPIIESTKATNDKITVSSIGVPHSSRNTGNRGVWLMSLRVAPGDLAWHYLKRRMQS